jgi:hypothetical protein
MKQTRSKRYRYRRNKGGRSRKQRKSRQYGGNNLTNMASALATNFMVNAGRKMGIDVTNPQQVDNTLTKINETFTNPENVDKMKQTIGNMAHTGADVLEAAGPFITPLVDKTIEEGTKAASKIGESAIKIGLNTAEEIPGVGVLIGTARSLSNAGEAITAATDAAAKVIEASSETVNATAKNWERLQAEKQATLARINNTTTRFNQPFMSIADKHPSLSPHQYPQHTQYSQNNKMNPLQ